MYGWTRDAVIGAEVRRRRRRRPRPRARVREAPRDRAPPVRRDPARGAHLRRARARPGPGRSAGRGRPCAPTSPSGAAPKPPAAPLEERYTAVVASLEEGIVVSDDQGVITAANRAAESILGRRIMVGERLDTVFSEELRARHPDGFLITDDEHPTVRTLRTGESFTNVLIGIELADREQRWLSLNSRPAAPRRPLPYGMVCSFSDVTERRRTERQLNYQATHDSLTGLANRPVFIENLRQTLDHAPPRRLPRRRALHRPRPLQGRQRHAGPPRRRRGADARSPRRLQQTTRSIDTVARLSGDEFVVLCPDLADIEPAAARADEIADVIAEPIPVSSGRDVVITASVGVSCVESGLADPEAMLARRRRRDVHGQGARPRARRAARQHAARAGAAPHARSSVTCASALDNDELAVHYQPIVDRRRRASSASRRWPAGPTRTGRSPRTSSSRSPRSPASSSRSASGS